MHDPITVSYCCRYLFWKRYSANKLSRSFNADINTPQRVSTTSLSLFSRLHNSGEMLSVRPAQPKHILLHALPVHLRLTLFTEVQFFSAINFYLSCTCGTVRASVSASVAYGDGFIFRRQPELLGFAFPWQLSVAPPGEEGGSFPPMGGRPKIM